MEFIEIDSTDGQGGFLIHADEGGKEIANELLKNPKYIIKSPTLLSKEICRNFKLKLKKCWEGTKDSNPIKVLEGEEGSNE